MVLPGGLEIEVIISQWEWAGRGLQNIWDYWALEGPNSRGICLTIPNISPNMLEMASNGRTFVHAREKHRAPPSLQASLLDELCGTRQPACAPRLPDTECAYDPLRAVRRIWRS